MDGEVHWLQGRRPAKLPWGERKRERERVQRRGWGSSELYREDPLWEGQFSPWAGKFKVGDKVCQVGMLGEPEFLVLGSETEHSPTSPLKGSVMRAHAVDIEQVSMRHCMTRIKQSTDLAMYT